MIFATFFCFLSMMLMSGDCNPTIGGGVGYVEGGGYGVDGGSVTGEGKQGNHAHFHSGRGGVDHGNSYGDDRRSKDVYRGEHDRHRDHSDRNRALINRSHNRKAGDSFQNKGKFDDGFHNVYHKEEYSKNNKFFDTDRDNKLQQNFNDFGNFYGDVDGHYYDDAYNGGAAIVAGGRRGHNYGKKYYDDGESEYANKDYGKQHQGHGKEYSGGGGNQHAAGQYYY